MTDNSGLQPLVVASNGIFESRVSHAQQRFDRILFVVFQTEDIVRTQKQPRIDGSQARRRKATKWQRAWASCVNETGQTR